MTPLPVKLSYFPLETSLKNMRDEINMLIEKYGEKSIICIKHQVYLAQHEINVFVTERE